MKYEWVFVLYLGCVFVTHRVLWPFARQIFARLYRE